MANHDEKLNKWIEVMTPRRAIDNFFAHATPVDSPDPDELFEPSTKFDPPEEVTPIAGSSQNSQKSRVQKRKLVDEEQSQGNVSKKNYVDETQTEIFQNDSILGTSEFPSRLESPNLVIPPRPNKKNKERMSVTAFAKAIQSQQSWMVNTSEDQGESSIPSVLGSPDEVLSQRPLRSKKRTSVTMFKETLGRKKIQESIKEITALPGLDESELESSGVPSNLESPEYVNSKNRSVHKSKSRMSTTTFKKILEEQQEQDSGEIPSSLDSPEKGQQVDRFVSTSKTRMSTTAFLNVLENKRNEEDEMLAEDFLGSQSILHKTSDSQLNNQSSGISKGNAILPEINSPSDGNVSTLRSKRSSESGSILKSFISPSTETVEKPNFEEHDKLTIQSTLSDQNSDLGQYFKRSGHEEKPDSSIEVVELPTEIDHISQSEMKQIFTIEDQGKINASLTRTITEQLGRSVNRRTSVAIEPRRSIQLNTNIEVTKTSENSSKASDSELSDESSMPELESPDFSTATSSTQITKNIQLVTHNSTVEQRKETLDISSDQSHYEKSIVTNTPISSVSINNSTSEIPSQLTSPHEYKQYNRPGPASSKKRVSTTGFLTALSQNLDVIPSSDSAVKVPTIETKGLALNSPISSTAVTGHESPPLVEEEIEKFMAVSRPSSQASNKSLSSLKDSKRSTIPTSESDDADDPMIDKSVSSVIKAINKSLRSASRTSNRTSASTKSNNSTAQNSKSDDSASDDDLIFGKTATQSSAENTGKVSRSSSQISNRTSTSKSSDRTTRLSKSDESSSDDDPLFDKTVTPPAEDTGKISPSSSRTSYKSLPETSHQIPSRLVEMKNSSHSSSSASESSSSSNLITRKTIQRPESDEDDDSVLSKLPSPTAEHTGKISRNSSRPPVKSLSTFSRIVLVSESESEDSESPSLKQITEPMSSKTPSPVIAPVDEAKSSPLSSSGSRSRKSLKFDSPTTKEDSSAIPTTMDDQPLINEAEVEETPPSDLDSTAEEKISEEEKSTEEIEEEEVEELSAKSRRTAYSSRESSRFSRKSEKTGMSPSNRYPALKNSTVVAGGAEFTGAPLSMSPIRPGEQGAPLLVLSTPKSSATDSPKALTVTSTNVKLRTPKTVKKTPSHPSTPAPFARKRLRSTTQSPMFMNVMKSSVKKAISNIAQDEQRVISATPTTSRVPLAKTPKDQQLLTSATLTTPRISTAKNSIASKGLSISNPGKGKSLIMSGFDKKNESSDTEWEEEFEVDPELPKPRCINIAFEEIQDRSKDFIPLEKRLMADPVFQAKVKTQRAKVAAQKEADEAAAATKNKRKPRLVAAKRKEEDNIANVATNKGNLRFYARTKVTKEALEAVHGLVGEWFDFTLDQMENFCIDEGKPSLDSWEDCYKMMKRQGIVKNYMEYSGLCHELLLNDECAQLLPTSFPPEFYEWKREAKRQKK